MRTALDETRADGLTVVPVCPYVAGFLKNEQEYDGAFRAVRPADLEYVQERQRS
ncbi:N-acetyltransferase [Calidifontibacter indicus]|uniref:N-acetyltransferase n=1 Tax=Calidifontibacter indicus TaxID=419650 RepID=UPI003D7452F3